MNRETEAHLLCGIAGKVYASRDHEVSRELLQSMNDLLAHRGPDDEGMYCQANAGLAMRRLSIIDLEGGHQPVSNEDNSLWIVFNGEIYNYRELREELVERGHQFQTHCDTEVILHLYEEKREKCLDHLRGMFAIAIWDEKGQELFLARDRVGKKPLCYAEPGSGIVFASELKAILADPAIGREVDLEALDLYLQYQFVPAPRTLFEGIHKLPPAHYLLWKKGEARLCRYWSLPSGPPRQIRDEDAVEQLQHILTESIKYRLISDVPVGAFLSGGLDSTTITGLMARLAPEPVRTYSIGFQEKDFDELPYARQAAEAFQTEHKEYVVQPDVVESLEELVWFYDEPFADKSALPTFYLCRQAARDVKVALCGDGGDEAFAGYGKYAAANQAHLAARAAEWLEDRKGRSLLRALWKGEGGAVGHALRRRLMKSTIPAGPSVFYSSFFDGRAKMNLLQPDIHNAIRNEGLEQVIALWEQARKRRPTVLDTMLDFDFNWYLPGDLLVKTDIASMAHGLELRSPFLDHHLLEFAFSLPPRLKVFRGQTKWLLKLLSAEFVPPEILERKKKGFSVPLKHWLQNDLSGLLKKVLLERGPCAERFFSRGALEQMVGEHLSGKKSHTSRLWALLLFFLWYRRFIENKTLS